MRSVGRLSSRDWQVGGALPRLSRYGASVSLGQEKDKLIAPAERRLSGLDHQIGDQLGKAQGVLDL